jgi:hypothetical protein
MKATLRQQIEAFDNKQFIDDKCYYFYDWFCKEKALQGKAKSLMAKAKKFATKTNIDLDKHYVWFKNNCPMNGPLYDDFRISNIETGDVVYNVSPLDGHTGMARIYSAEVGFDKPLAEACSWKDLLKLI